MLFLAITKETLLFSFTFHRNLYAQATPIGLSF
jgi:hypothetical protein